jgi:sugar phosphate isomerase/epimerase
MKKAIQQMMIGPLCSKYDETLSLLKKLKELGFDAIELNSYMIHETPFMVRMLTKMAGMPTGKGGKLDWHKLIKESSLEVASLHTDLGSLERETDKIISEAKEFNTKYLVITGMYRFDYSSIDELDKLISRLNIVGKKVSDNGLSLLYHNHNVEFNRLNNGQLAYEYLIDNLDPKYVNFELDTYWASEAGVNIYALGEKLNHRLKLHHINDRGFKTKGPYMTPIVKSDSMELGTGCIDLKTLLKNDIDNEVSYVVLETHKNFIDNDRMKSILISIKYLNENL